MNSINVETSDSLHTVADIMRFTSGLAVAVVFWHYDRYWVYYIDGLHNVDFGINESIRIYWIPNY